MPLKKIRIDKFNIFLPDWWQDISNSNPDGPPTFIDGRLEEPGVLQISTAIYVSSEKPNPNFEDLIQLSEMLGQRNAFGDVVNRTFGKCKLGKYGMVEFSGENFPYISVCHLSNGKDFVFGTFICSKNPETSEINDANGILLNLKKRMSFF